jgi:hypothetical protein
MDEFETFLRLLKGTDVNPETQAAITAAQAAVSTALATWALFLATCALVLITIIAVIAGLIAAFSATEALQLEAEPVLILTEMRSKLGNKPVLWGPKEQRLNVLALLLERCYVVSGNPAIVNGLSLYTLVQFEKSVPFVAGAKKRPSIELKVKNVGRSPALAVEVYLEVSVPISFKKSIEKIPGFQIEPDQETNYHYSGTLRSIGTIHLPAIPSQKKLLVRIENSLGLEITLTPQTEGRRALWHKKGHPPARIAVLAPDGPFKIEAHDGTTDQES